MYTEKNFHNWQRLYTVAIRHNTEYSPLLLPTLFTWIKWHPKFVVFCDICQGLNYCQILQHYCHDLKHHNPLSCRIALCICVCLHYHILILTLTWQLSTKFSLILKISIIVNYFTNMTLLLTLQKLLLFVHILTNFLLPCFYHSIQ